MTEAVLEVAVEEVTEAALAAETEEASEEDAVVTVAEEAAEEEAVAASVVHQRPWFSHTSSLVSSP